MLDKSKSKSKRMSKKIPRLQRRRLQKTKFCWTDDEIQLLLKSVNQYKYKCEYVLRNKLGERLLYI